MVDIDLRLGDCLETLPTLPDNSVDAVITDPPYGVTQHKDDVVVDLTPVFRLSTAVILFAQQPYTTDVIMQHRDVFRYDLVWNKVLVSGHLNAKNMPMRQHESILVFGKPVYNPQMTLGNKSHSKGKPKVTTNNNYGEFGFVDNRDKLGNSKYPVSIQVFAKPHPSVSQHRTQKPLELMEWLISTYTNEADTILDPFMGSGTTGVACVQTGRNFIGIEIEPKYYDIAKKRIAEAQLQTRMEI